MPPTKIQTYLDKDTVDKIRMHAESKNLSVYRYVRDVLEDHVKNNGKEKMQNDILKRRELVYLSMP